ncbi:MAG TPA: stage III sporulation protein AD [Bacillota bacterium]
MDFFAIIGFGLVATVLLIILRKERPEIAVLVGIAATGLMIGALIHKIADILVAFETLAVRAEVNGEYLKLCFKIVGLAYLAGLGAQICKDAGENTMAAKIELAGKIFILGLGVPVMAGLLDLILKLF